MLEVAVLIGDRFEQLLHQPLQALQPRRQRRLGLLPGLELARMEAILLASGEAFVIGLLANRLELIERQRFDFLDRHVLATRQLFDRFLHAGR